MSVYNPYLVSPRITFATGRALAAAPRWNKVLNQVEEHQVEEHQEVQEVVIVDLNTTVQIEVCLDGSLKLQTTYTRAAYLHDPHSFQKLLWDVKDPQNWSALAVTASAETDSDHAAMNASMNNGDSFAAVHEVHSTEELGRIVQEHILCLYEDPALGVQNPVSRRHWKFMIWTEDGLNDLIK
jgi:hypothetical protein